jgi:uncharacterized Zn finger protein
LPTETAQEKGWRLLKEQRLTIVQVDKHDGLVVARCEGDTSSYMLGWDPMKHQWRCTCPELKGQCSHLAALKCVVRRAS